MPVPSLYLDTSVLGGCFDDEWQAATQELWRQMEAGQWRFFTSLIAAEELAGAPSVHGKATSARWRTGRSWRICARRSTNGGRSIFNSTRTRSAVGSGP